MKSNTYTLCEYVDKIAKNGSFIIPSYQRGYVWGQKKSGQKKDSITNIMDSLIDGFSKDKDVFLQGITVCEDGNNVILVDGQQRTTFFYLLLKFLNYSGHLSIKYSVRTESDHFLQNLSIDEILKSGIDPDEKYQDVFFSKIL